MNHAASQEITAEFAGLSEESQAQFLCRPGVRMTTLSRSFVSGRKKQGANEICHRIFGQLGHIMSSDSKQRYADATFVDLLSAIAAENNLAKEFSDALASMLNRNEWDVLPSGDA